MQKVVVQNNPIAAAASKLHCQNSALLPGRLAALDELRAVAILSMVLAHFGPGTLQRIPNTEAYMDMILFWGHFATVTFILVFGITLGFVHYNRFHSEERKRTQGRLLARTRLVFLCAIIIGFPNFISECTFDQFASIRCLSQFYSPLNFYVLGLLSAPFWLTALNTHPFRNGLILGLGHWTLAAILLALWPIGKGFNSIEYFRMILVSGPYPYLQLSGCALAIMPVGIFLRQAVNDGDCARLLSILAVLGLLMAAAGFALGQWVGEFDIHAINTGELKSPPRLWYWLFFAGPTLLILAGLVALELRVPAVSDFLYPLALFGIGALSIYTAHTFVLPALDLVSTKIPIEGYVRIVFAFSMFAIYCLAVMWYYHAKFRAQRTRIAT